MVQKNEFFCIKFSKGNHRHIFFILYQIVIRNAKREIQSSFTLFLLNMTFFFNSFFPSAMIEWNKLDCCISHSDSFEVFKKCIFSFIRPMQNGICNIHNPLGIKYLNRLRTGFTHLKEHKFKHNFQDSIDPLCSSISGIETTINFPHYTNFSTQRQTLFDRKATIDVKILTELVNTLLFGKPKCENSFNKAMLNTSIEFILSTERFNSPLF